MLKHTETKQNNIVLKCHDNRSVRNTHINPKPSIRRVWPTSPLAQSACTVLWRHNLARKDAMFVRGVVWHEVWRWFDRILVNYVFTQPRDRSTIIYVTYASNDEMAAFAAQSWLRDHW